MCYDKEMKESFYEFMSLDGRTVVMVLETTEARARTRCECYFLNPRTIPVDGESVPFEVDMTKVNVRDVPAEVSGMADRMRSGNRMVFIGLAARH